MRIKIETICREIGIWVETASLGWNCSWDGVGKNGVAMFLPVGKTDSAAHKTALKRRRAPGPFSAPHAPCAGSSSDAKVTFGAKTCLRALTLLLMRNQNSSTPYSTADGRLAGGSGTRYPLRGACCRVASCAVPRILILPAMQPTAALQQSRVSVRETGF